MSSTTIDPRDPSYPSSLADLAASSGGLPTLYLRGKLPAGPGIAVVGTRKPSEAACAFTRDLVRDLVAHGLVVWSGGARGIDAAAHEAALDAGAITVSALGSGHDFPYPPEHVPLFERILAQGGALVARVADPVPPIPGSFLRRNELLAAATVATVVIEAGVKSGARSTAAAARRLCRPLLVVPHAPWDERGAGCALELSLGARPLTCAADVLAAIGLPRPARRPASSSPRRSAGARARTDLPAGSVDRPARREPEPAPSRAIHASAREGMSPLLSALGDEPAHLDELCERTNLPLPAVAEELLTLTWQAVVVEGPAGFFRRVRR